MIKYKYEFEGTLLGGIEFHGECISTSIIDAIKLVKNSYLAPENPHIKVIKEVEQVSAYSVQCIVFARRGKRNEKKDGN